MNTRSVWRPDKDEVVVEHGAVATAHPIAAQVGVDILKSGGNAVDAAIATGFCLNVVEPASSSIAGHGQMIVHMTVEGRSVAIDCGHRAPKAATADMFRVIGQAVTGNGIYEVEGRANAIGHRSVGVPGVTAGMCRAHELFGTLPLEQLLEPAVHYARKGFEADPHHMPADRQKHAKSGPIRRGSARLHARRISPRHLARESSSATWPTPSNGSE